MGDEGQVTSQCDNCDGRGYCPEPGPDHMLTGNFIGCPECNPKAVRVDAHGNYLPRNES